MNDILSDNGKQNQFSICMEEYESAYQIKIHYHQTSTWNSKWVLKFPLDDMRVR